MNAKQDAKVSMYRAIVALCDDNTQTISANAASLAAFGDFKTNIAAVNVAAPDGSDQTPFTTLSDPAGAYSFKPLPHADYTLTVTALGYTNYEADNIDVKMGEINTLDVELVK